jgi:hypothetical protein
MWNWIETQHVNVDNVMSTFSFHPLIANVLTCDGSVHPLRETISSRVFGALATRSGGEVVLDSDWE